MSTSVSTPGSVEAMRSVKGDRTAYLANLLELRSDLSLELVTEDLGSWLRDVRDRAAAEVRSLSLPTMRDEEWRFTNLAPLLEVSFQAATHYQSLAVGLDVIEPFILPEAVDTRLVFVDGVYAPQLSSVNGLPSGAIAGSLMAPDSAGVTLSDLKDYFAQGQGLEKTFTALNTASFADVAVVRIPKNVEVETPIHLLFVSTASETPTLTHPRCLIVAEPNSAVTVVEDYVSVGDGRYFTNSVTEIWLAENAQVNHTRVQRDRTQAFHIGKTAVSQARSSRYIGHAVSLGASLSRYHPEIFQLGEQTETTLNGLTMISGSQLGDTHSLIAFSKPHGMSRQLQKCIVDEKAHAVFNGKVTVPRAAQLTDAGQLNRNLLLSSKGRVDTKPQLEIVADNVKCTHGATVSQLDADEVFYLQSRGIDSVRAQSLLIYAFAAEIIEQIPVASVKQTLSQSVETFAR